MSTIITKRTIQPHQDEQIVEQTFTDYEEALRVARGWIKRQAGNLTHADHDQTQGYVFLSKWSRRAQRRTMVTVQLIGEGR